MSENDRSAKNWVLEGIDEGFKLKFQGQYIAEGLQDSISSELSETKAINKQTPNYQYSSGNGDMVNFTSKLFAVNALKNIKQEIEILKRFSKRDSGLKRLPRVLFTAGTEIGFTCFVKSVGFAYGELRDDGSIREAVISISLQKIEDTVTDAASTTLRSQVKFASGAISAGAALFAKSAKGLINIPGGSLHTIGRKHPVLDGETFESIAAVEYGDAKLGDILRRAQPELEPLEAGKIVTLVDKTDIRTITVTPQSISLKSTVENNKLFNEKLAARSKKVVIFK